MRPAPSPSWLAIPALAMSSRCLSGTTAPAGSSLTAVVHRPSATDPQRRRTVKHFEGVKLDPGASPILALSPLVPRIAEFIGGGKSAPVRRATSAQLGELPATPALLASWAAESPLRRAAALDLLAALTPPDDARGRQRLVVDALREVALVDQRSADAAFLRAYALLRADIRPLAIAVAREVDAPANRALVEIANGNVAEAAAAIAKVQAPVPRIILELELGELRALYGLTFDGALLAQTSAFVDRHPAWRDLLQARVVDYDLWHLDAMPSAKRMLDVLFPATGIDAESVERGIVALACARLHRFHRVFIPSTYGACAARIRGSRRAYPASPAPASGAQFSTCWNRARSPRPSDGRRTSELQGHYAKRSACTPRSTHVLLPSGMGNPTATMRDKASERATPVERHAAYEALSATPHSSPSSSRQSKLARDALRFMATPSEASRPFLQVMARQAVATLLAGDRWTFDRAVVLAERMDALSYAETEAGAHPRARRRKERSSCSPRSNAAARSLRPAHARKSYMSTRAPHGARCGTDRDARLAAAVRQPPDFNSYIALADYQMKERGDYASAEQVFASFPTFAPGAPVDNAVAKTTSRRTRATFSTGRAKRNARGGSTASLLRRTGS